MFTFEITGVNEFQDWLLELENKFTTMVQTMIDVAHLVESNTMWRVPLETGRLEHSYKFVVVENNPNLIEVEIGYDAVDPKSGFMYAEYQHENELNHPFRGEQFYLKNGIQSSTNEAMVMIEKDYFSLFGV